jgi:hypothetical protein
VAERGARRREQGQAGRVAQAATGLRERGPLALGQPGEAVELCRGAQPVRLVVGA